MIKIGIGQDSHRFGSKKPLILGCIEIPSDSGLIANSDGDAILHALFNAISSALGGRSIGYYYPKSEGDSRQFFKTIDELLNKHSYKVNNISIAIEAKKPRLDNYIMEMQKQIAKLLKVEESCVGITITSGEELTPFGQAKGIQVFAITTLTKC